MSQAQPPGYQTSLTQAAVVADADQSDPEPETLGARLAPGFTTRYEREERSDDRVVTSDACTRCGAAYAGSGVCEECRSQGDVLDDHGLRNLGGGD